MSRERRVLTTGERIALTGVVGLASFATLTFGASAAFTSTVSATQSIDSGTVTLELGADGTAANRLSVAATNIAAGDTIERAVDLSNAGTLDLSTVALTTTATTSSLLDTDTTQGLHLTVESCSLPWIEAGVAPGYTYTCAGVQSTLITRSPVIQADTDLAAVEITTSGGTVHLRTTLDLPAEADNTLQGQASVIEYEFTGVQRTTTSR